MFFRKKDPYKKLKKLIGSEKVLDRAEDKLVYAGDASYTAPPGNHKPDLVVLPESIEDVCETILFAEETGMHVIPRGAGTGMSSGAVPIGGGIVISMEKMISDPRLNVEERWLDCEMGLKTEDIKKAAAKQNLLYPPDPSSFRISTIGGNIAENAGGLRCVKYGTTKDYVLGLKYVDAEGHVVSTGVYNTEPTPVDLTPLLVGSEGLFGVIVQARLALIPAPESTYTLLAHFSDIKHALASLHKFLPKVTPSVCELMDDLVIGAIRKHDPYPFPTGTEAAMLIETDGKQESAANEAKWIEEVLRAHNALEVHRTQDKTERERLWNLRRLVSPALSHIATGKMNEDVVVPISAMAELIERCRKIGEESGVKVPIYGHAGDGNLHLNVMYDKSEQKMETVAHQAISRCFKVVVELGGTISGEHGIGASKNRFITIQYSTEQLRLLKAIKDAFDPNGMFNPYKVLPPTM